MIRIIIETYGLGAKLEAERIIHGLKQKGIFVISKGRVVFPPVEYPVLFSDEIGVRVIEGDEDA